MLPSKTPALAWVVALLTAASVGQAQDTEDTSGIPEDGTVVGVVIDENGGAPVRGALVLLSDGRSTSTDEDGGFSFRHVRPGTHQIAAVTQGCAKVEGGFSVASGTDARLRLMVDVPTREIAEEERGRGTSMTVLEDEDLAPFEDRSIWHAIQQKVPYHMDRTTRGTSLRSTRAATIGSAEPLLIMDGVRMAGDIHRVLNNVATTDVKRVEIHRGAVSGWEFGYGAENGVIVVTTRLFAEMGPNQSPESCVRMN